MIISTVTWARITRGVERAIERETVLWQCIDTLGDITTLG